MATNKNKMTSVGKDVEKLEPRTLLVGMWTSMAAVDNRMTVPEKFKHRITTQFNHVTHDWATELNWTGCIFPKELKAGSWMDICIPVFIAVLFAIAKR